MKTQFIPIDYSAFDFKGKNWIKIIGRSSAGKRVCVVEKYDANFWAILKHGLSEKKIAGVVERINKIRVEGSGRKTCVLKTELCDKKFLGKDVKAIRVFVSNFKDAHDVANKMGFDEIVARREYDISIISKYIMEGGLAPLEMYEIDGEEISNSDDFGGIGKCLDVELCIKLGKKNKINEEKFEPRILAYDIETDDFELGKGNILMVSLYGKNFKKVLTWKKCEGKQDFVECFKDEADMLEAFVENVKKYSPDLLVGYFSDGFDLPYLRARAQKCGVKLSLGIDDSQPVFRKGRVVSGRIDGIVHVDLFRFIQTVYSQYLKSETLSLNEVASELLGERKYDFDFSKIGNMKDSDWKDFFGYNLQDSVLTFKLAEKLWLDMVEFCKIIKEPLWNITRDSMSAHVENYILHNLDKFNEIGERRPKYDEIGERRGRGKYEGAFVFEPKPGLYENIVMFDFTSMYASVIVSYNLSRSTLKGVSKNGGKVEFTKERGFFPELLDEIIRLRKKYKQEYSKDKNNLKKARSNAYKLLANAAYGYQGFFGARYYCLEAAAATAEFARENIHSVIDKIEKGRYKIIYSDTDSIAFLQNKKTKKQVLDMLKKINKELPGIMELELEDFYKKGLFVSKKTTQAGAKKKYALIDEKGKVKIRGFETVRRDWCALARDLQNKVIEKVLKDGDGKSALRLVKEVIEKLKKREIDLKDLMIRTQLKKQITNYVARGPHVIAAEKMEAAGIPVSQGMLIEYYIAESKGGGKKLVRERVKLLSEKGRYDAEYYLKNQIGAAVESILEVFGVDVAEIIDGERQKKLF